jgi:hypothetical protein
MAMPAPHIAIYTVRRSGTDANRREGFSKTPGLPAGKSNVACRTIDDLEEEQQQIIASSNRVLCDPAVLREEIGRLSKLIDQKELEARDVQSKKSCAPSDGEGIFANPKCGCSYSPSIKTRSITWLATARTSDHSASSANGASHSRKFMAA